MAERLKNTPGEKDKISVKHAALLGPLGYEWSVFSMERRKATWSKADPPQMVLVTLHYLASWAQVVQTGSQILVG